MSFLLVVICVVSCIVQFCEVLNIEARSNYIILLPLNQLINKMFVFLV